MPVPTPERSEYYETNADVLRQIADQSAILAVHGVSDPSVLFHQVAFDSDQHLETWAGIGLTPAEIAEDPLSADEAMDMLRRNAASAYITSVLHVSNYLSGEQDAGDDSRLPEASSVPAIQAESAVWSQTNYLPDRPAVVEEIKLNNVQGHGDITRHLVRIGDDRFRLLSLLQINGKIVDVQSPFNELIDSVDDAVGFFAYHLKLVQELVTTPVDSARNLELFMQLRHDELAINDEPHMIDNMLRALTRLNDPQAFKQLQVALGTPELPEAPTLQRILNDLKQLRLSLEA